MCLEGQALVSGSHRFSAVVWVVCGGCRNEAPAALVMQTATTLFRWYECDSHFNMKWITGFILIVMQYGKFFKENHKKVERCGNKAKNILWLILHFLI